LYIHRNLYRIVKISEHASYEDQSSHGYHPLWFHDDSNLDLFPMDNFRPPKLVATFFFPGYYKLLS
jgi:hypothetical protein